MRRLGFERSTLRSYTDGEEVPLPAQCPRRRLRNTNALLLQVLPGLFHLAESMYLFRRI